MSRMLRAAVRAGARSRGGRTRPLVTWVEGRSSVEVKPEIDFGVTEEEEQGGRCAVGGPLVKEHVEGEGIEHLEVHC